MQNRKPETWNIQESGRTRNLRGKSDQRNHAPDIGSRNGSNLIFVG